MSSFISHTNSSNTVIYLAFYLQKILNSIQIIKCYSYLKELIL